jgi:hypothetical protein
VWTLRRGWITNTQLLDEALAVCAGVQALDVPGPITVVERDHGEALILLIGVWLAAREAFIAAPDTSADRLRGDMAEAATTLILSTGGAPEIPGVRVIRKDELEGTEKKPVKPGKATAPALFVPSPAGVIVYSHFTLSSMATGLAAFVKTLRDQAYLCLTPLYTWEALSGAIGALVRRQPVVFAETASLCGNAVAIPQQEFFTIVTRADAELLMSADRAPRALRDAAYVFLSTGPFKPRWRRRFEAFLGRPILPVWGLPEIGPAVVAHPTWYPLESHGFPLVNVSIVPIDPDTGQQSVVPWEMLTLAEIGVETLSAALGYAQPDKAPDKRIGKVVRTRQIANIDHVGVVTLHGATGGG